MKTQLKNIIKITSTLGIFLTCQSQAANFNRVHCDRVKRLSHGDICSIKPSITDPRISDQAPSGSRKGFGHHVVGIPNNYSSTPDLHIHFTGSFGKAYEPKNKEFPSEQFLSETLEAGKLVVQLAYDNELSVNLNSCNLKGKYIDNCAGQMREEKLTGKNHSSLVKVRYYDGIDFRLKQLISYLKKSRVLPYNYAFNWANVSVSGHSQGAGMALYIAKKQKVKRACLIAGGYDIPDRVKPSRINLADWILKRGMATSKRKITSVLHTTDNFYSNFRLLNDYLNIYGIGNVYESSKRWMTDVKGNRITEGHPAAINAVQLKNLRMDACFN